jgi:hypothetical protein
VPYADEEVLVCERQTKRDGKSRRERIEKEYAYKSGQISLSTPGGARTDDDAVGFSF